jgi:site-specific DNA recombinase
MPQQKNAAMLQGHIMADRSQTPLITNNKIINCAIYTRKSTSNGLEQDFNTLQAQRETCEAYIMSQKHAGWKTLDTEYDDGGFSGGNVERPAFRRLMQDMRDGLVDVVVVYKVDRLTRSLRDFARIVDELDQNQASFVSVTQQFNTTTAIGRLTLNMLLSFAQFERELSSERVRDKITASKKKGMWMGGHVPLGYDMKDKCLIINESEARVVEIIFQLYLELGAAHHVALGLNDMGHRTKIRCSKTKGMRGGQPFTRGHVYYILANQVYIGRTTHKEKTYDGLHKPIIGDLVWKTVQARLKRNMNGKRRRERAKEPSLLCGKLFDHRGERLSPTHSVKNGKRYRYYVSRSILTRPAGRVGEGWRISAWELEKTVFESLAGFFGNHQKLLRITGLGNRETENIGSALVEAEKFANILKGDNSKNKIELIEKLIEQVILRDHSLSIKVRLTGIFQLLGMQPNTPRRKVAEKAIYSITFPFRIKKRGVEAKLVIGGKIDVSDSMGPHRALVKAISRGTAWFEKLRNGDATSIEGLAQELGLNRAYVSRVIAFAFVSPTLIEAALKGETDRTVNVNQLIQSGGLPILWRKQEQIFGINHKNN